MSDRSVTRLGVLDGLRGLAILMVVWYHLWLVSGYTIPLLGFAQVLVQNGFLGVDLFFFLSGFCIALPYARARRDGTPVPHASDFARKRALKILPSYLLALGVFAIAFRDRFDGPLQELGHFAAHAAFVHVFSPVTFGSFSGPLWTLAVEVQFYVLFALIAPFVVKRPFLVYAMLVAAAVLYRTAIAALGFDGDFGWVNQLPAVLDVFGGGVAAAFAYTMLGARQRSPLLGTAAAAIGGGLALGALVAAASIAANGGDEAVHRWLNAWRVAFGPVLFVATLGLALGSSRVYGIASARPLRGLSAISYGAYLCNLEIVVAFSRSGLPSAAVFWLGALVTILVSALVTYGFERPIQRAGVTPLVTAIRRMGTALRLRRVAEA
jgi:peptidoglycan/LPS O-acetylase OafA/YrhL